MTLHRFRCVGERLVGPLVGPARSLGLSPDGVTLLGLAVAATGAVGFALSTPAAYLAGAVLVAASGVLDVLDGVLARRTGRASRAGELLDHSVDRYADATVVAGIVVGSGRYALGIGALSGVLLTSYAGTACEAAGLDDLLTGALCRADRIALFVAGTALTAAGVDGADVAVLWLLAIGGHVVAIARTWRGLCRLR